jgi:acyl-homoserine-lactone acylase
MLTRLMPSLLLAAACAASAPGNPEMARWEAMAGRVTITRDDWGIPHVEGRTDADAVFGLMYAQAEDDFNRVETNYLNALGRLSEAEGESEIYRDLRMKLFIDPDTLRALYHASPAWLRTLMDAWADGLNYFLATHPEVRPRVLTRFEPWMALSFSEGSIGGDIESISLDSLKAFYGGEPVIPAAGNGAPPEPGGSNGIAIAPGNTVAGRTLFLINPHTSFFFRAEAQMRSEEGLNVYGAITWGQFFVYQGFNDRAGWMHTSSGADNIDEYLETVIRKDPGLVYRYGAAERPVLTSTITVPYKADSAMARRVFTVFRTHHGPVVRAQDGKWVTVRLMHDPVTALTQSYRRTKARSYREFRETMELHTNSSNNTVYADADGTIAYFHANFIPRRDDRFDWSRPVNGADPATEWGPPLGVEQSPLVVNPPGGWLYNTNNSPWSAAGPASPKAADFPRYVESGGENARGLHAVRVLENRKDFSIDALIAAAYDSYLPAFAPAIPALLAAYDRLPASSPIRSRLAGQIEMLRDWDLRWSESSAATTLAIAWGEELTRRFRAKARPAAVSAEEHALSRSTPAEQLEALGAASDSLEARHGAWRTAWGEINRFQRLTGDIEHTFSDSGASIPVGFPSARWGSLASFVARSYPGTRKRYGNSGNSFVAVVEFGDSVRARAVTAGGQSGDPASPHFNDQATRYSSGRLREVYFYPHQLRGHTERSYRPGD